MRTPLLATLLLSLGCLTVIDAAEPLPPLAEWIEIGKRKDNIIKLAKPIFLAHAGKLDETLDALIAPLARKPREIEERADSLQVVKALRLVTEGEDPPLVAFVGYRRLTPNLFEYCYSIRTASDFSLYRLTCYTHKQRLAVLGTDVTSRMSEIRKMLSSMHVFEQVLNITWTENDDGVESDDEIEVF